MFIYSYKIILNSDREEYGGFNRIDDSMAMPTTEEGWDNRRCSMYVYIPSRVCMALALY